MKLGIVIGHTKRSQGAVAFDGQTEYVWNGKVAEQILISAKKYSGIEVFVERRDVGGLRGAFERLKKLGVQSTIELHFNSFSKAAFGCECLALAGDIESITDADLVTDL